MNQENNINSNLPKLISPKELKAYLQCGDEKLYNLLKSKTFPSLQIDSRWYIIEEEVIKWIYKQTTKLKS